MKTIVKSFISNHAIKSIIKNNIKFMNIVFKNCRGFFSSIQASSFYAPTNKNTQCWHLSRYLSMKSKQNGASPRLKNSKKTNKSLTQDTCPSSLLLCLFFASAKNWDVYISSHSLEYYLFYNGMYDVVCMYIDVLRPCCDAIV